MNGTCLKQTNWKTNRIIDLYLKPLHLLDLQKKAYTLNNLNLNFTFKELETALHILYLTNTHFVDPIT
jgi:hypothetical protein